MGRGHCNAFKKLIASFEPNYLIMSKAKQGQVRGQEDVCANLQDLELKEGREGTLQHGPGAILKGAIGSCRDPTSPPKSPSSR